MCIVRDVRWRSLKAVHNRSKSSGLNPACRRMLLRVPIETSRWRGTMATLRPSGVSFANFTWLPFWLTMRNPAASNFRFTSRYDKGLRGTNLYLQFFNLWHNSGARLFKVKFQCLLQVGKGFLFCSPLAGYINFKALSDEPFAFTPNDSRKAALHHIAPPLRETPSLKLPKPSGIITAASKWRQNCRKLTVSATRRRRDLCRLTSLIQSTACQFG